MFDGKRTYFGPIDESEAEQRYRAAVAEWIAGHGRQTVKRTGSLVVSELIERYLDHAERIYAGTPEYGNYATSLGIVASLDGALPAERFGPLQLRAVRQTMIGKG